MFKTLAYCICYLINPFSFLFPRKKNRSAFGSFRGAFNDNAKYLFIYANEHCPDKELAWRGFEKNRVQYGFRTACRQVYQEKIQGSFLSSRIIQKARLAADIRTFSDINVRQGVPHTGIEMPGIRISKECYPDIQSGGNMQFVKRYETPETEEQIRSLGNYRKVYIYMPTWRDSQREIFVQNIDLQKLNEVLSANGDLLLLKPHANTIVTDSVDDCSNIRLVDSKVDVYPLLPFTDVLITDYSSILYDYILMPGKAVLLYLYDYAEYVRERDFYYPFNENVIGERAHNSDELIAAILKGVPVLDEDARLALVNKFWGSSHAADSCSCLIDCTL